MSVTLLLVRHGQTEENLAHILQGQHPGHLTEEGRLQAKRVSQELRNEHIDVFLTSDLKRAVDTSHIINETLHLNLILEPLLRERDFGKYTGRSYGVVIDPEDKDVESVDELYERARLWLEKITSLYNNQVVLAVSHGLFLRFIQAVCRNTSIKDIPRMDNTEIRRLLVHQPTSCDTSGEQVESVES